MREPSAGAIFGLLQDGSVAFECVKWQGEGYLVFVPGGVEHYGIIASSRLKWISPCHRVEVLVAENSEKARSYPLDEYLPVKGLFWMVAGHGKRPHTCESSQLSRPMMFRFFVRFQAGSGCCRVRLNSSLRS